MLFMQAVGIHVDGAILRRAVVRRRGKNLVIESLQSVGRVKPVYTEAKGIPLVSGLSSSDLLVHSSSIPASHKRQKVKEALKIQTEAQIHLEGESLISVVLLNQKRKKATIYSTTQQALSSHLQEMELFQQEPDRVGAISEALKAFVNWKEPNLLSYFLVDFGLSETQCLWVEEGLVQKAYTLPYGIQDLNEVTGCNVAKEGDLPQDRARQFRSELSRTLHSFQCLRPMIVTGEERDDYLAEPLKSCSSGERQLGLSPDEQRYAVSVGLAIDYLMNRKDPVQFRGISGLSRRNFSLVGRNILIVSLLSLGCCGLLFGMGMKTIHQRERKLISNLNVFVEGDAALQRELYSAGQDPASLVHQWSQMVRRYGKEFPYLVRVPRVAELLDWLKDKPFAFESIRYQLVSFPRIDETGEPYLGKVEIEFKAENPGEARLWHEQLLQGEGLCDAEQEVAWEQLFDRFSVSFFLKNRKEPDV